MNDRCKSRLNAGAYTEVFFPCHHIHRVFFPALFISIQRHSDEKEFRSCLSREVSPLHAFLAALLARLRVTQDQIHPKISGCLQKRKRISPPPHSITLSPKGREEQNVCQNHGTLPSQMNRGSSRYISALLEKNKSLYKALHFTENHLPQTQRNPTWQAVCISFFHIHTYIYVHRHIYVCVSTCVCIYSVT